MSFLKSINNKGGKDSSTADKDASEESSSKNENVTSESVQRPNGKIVQRSTRKKTQQKNVERESLGVEQDRETRVSRGSDMPAPVPKALSQKALLEFMIGLDYPLEGKDYFIAWLTRTYTRKGRSRKSTGKARTIVLDFLMEVFQKLKKEGYI